jgi:hypothetical protein
MRLDDGAWVRGSKQVRFGIKLAQMAGTYDGVEHARLGVGAFGVGTAWHVTA